MISFNSDHRIFITGASSGIGKAIALLCNELGATVIASGRDIDRLNAVQAESTNPENFHIIARDLAKEMEELPTFVNDISQKYGKLSGMVCSAGKAWNASVQTYDLETAREAFDINCHAPLLLARGFVARRNNIGQGAAMVFITSVAGVVPFAGVGMYGASKAALAQGACCLAKEVAPRGIRVNCVSPSMVKTPMADATIAQLGPDYFERELALYPFGLGEPLDVANMVVFLLSSKTSWVTGQVIHLSGGR